MPMGGATLRRVMAFCAPLESAGKRERLQWVNALLALEPAVRHHPPLLVNVASFASRRDDGHGGGDDVGAFAAASLAIDSHVHGLGDDSVSYR